MAVLVLGQMLIEDRRKNKSVTASAGNFYLAADIFSPS